MPLVVGVYAVSWGIADKSLRQTSDYRVRLVRHLLPGQFVNTNSGYMGMWRVPLKLPLLTGLFL